ncbi:MAG: hypothetical protein WCE21_00600 [Candidatus Babeliales bacterium]
MNYIQKIDIKKIVFVITLALATGIATYWFFATSTQATAQTIPEYIQSYLQTLENGIWEKLAAQGITKEQFEQAYQNQFPHPTRHTDGKCHFDAGISTENRALIIAILKEQQIDPAIITVYAITIPSSAGAGVNELFINETHFNKLPLNQKRAVLRHEMTHIKFYDDYTFALFTMLLGTNPNEVLDQHDHILNVISRFQEIRADLLSLSSSLDTAHDFADYMEATIKKNLPEHHSHPTDKERLAWAHTIVDHLNAQPQGNIYA